MPLFETVMYQLCLWGRLFLTYFDRSTIDLRDKLNVQCFSAPFMLQPRQLLLPQRVGGAWEWMTGREGEGWDVEVTDGGVIPEVLLSHCLEYTFLGFWDLKRCVLILNSCLLLLGIRWKLKLLRELKLTHRDCPPSEEDRIGEYWLIFSCTDPEGRWNPKFWESEKIPASPLPVYPSSPSKSSTDSEMSSRWHSSTLLLTKCPRGSLKIFPDKSDQVMLCSGWCTRGRPNGTWMPRMTHRIWQRGFRVMCLLLNYCVLIVY